MEVVLWDPTALHCDQRLRTDLREACVILESRIRSERRSVKQVNKVTHLPALSLHVDDDIDD